MRLHSAKETYNFGLCSAGGNFALAKSLLKVAENDLTMATAREEKVISPHLKDSCHVSLTRDVTHCVT